VRITLTTPCYPPNLGGVEVHTQNLARRLARRHDVCVVTSSGWDERLRVVEVPSIPIPYSPIPLTFPKVSGDVYHSHIPSPFFAWEVHRRGLRPHVVTYHNDVVVPKRVNGIRIPRGIGRIVEDVNENVTIPILEGADAIIATTKSYAKTSPVLKEFDVEIIPNAVEVDRYEYCENKGDYVIYVGRIVEYKGLGLLLEAMRIVQRESDLELIVVGEGEDRRRFERLAELLGLNVRFLGRVEEKEKIELIKRARVLVLPSKSRLEAFGIVLLEAMACGTPVIGSDIAGVREIAREGGTIFHDVYDLAEKIVKISENDRLTRIFGRRGRRAVEEKYDWNIVIRKIEKIYHDLV